MKIYPKEYFCPKIIGTNKIKITENTYSIHHFESSWKSDIKIMRKIGYYLIPFKTIVKRVLKIKK